MTIQNRNNILLCETTADLQGVTGYPTLLAFVRGVVSPNDGQQGTFYWSGNSTLAGDSVTGAGPVNVVDPYDGHGPVGRWLRDTTGGGSGSLTQLNPGAGITLTPNPITLTGSVALATIAANTIMANLAATSQPPVGAGISAIIDSAISSTQGSVLYRGPTGWVALSPGANNTVLTISSALPAWVPGGIGTVTQLNTSQGITGGPISSTGTISLDSIPPNTVLGNASGSTQAAGATSLTQMLDSAFSSQTGATLYRAGSGWTALPKGAIGQVLTQASGAPSWSAVTGTGTVTSVGTGAGLTGGPITTAGTIAFATIAANTILANPTGGNATPVASSLSGILDGSVSASVGTIVYRAAGGWVGLPIGTVGQSLTVSSGQPAWASGGTGTVTAITAGSGLTAIGITSGIVSITGTLGFSTVPAHTLIANVSGATAVPVATSPSSFMDQSFSAGTGAIVYRAAGSWAGLSVGSNGQVLTVIGGVPAWGATSGTGTVTSVALGVPPIFGVSGSPVTTAGTLGMSVVAQGSNTFWAGPTSGVAATPSFRPLISGDIPVNPTFLGTTSVTGLSVAGSTTITGQIAAESSANFSGYVSFDQGLNVHVNVITSAATSYTIVSQVDYLIVVNQSSAVAISINLPASPAVGDVYAIKDFKGVAATYPITLVATSGNIDGQGSLAMNTNFGAVSVTAIANGGPYAVT